VSLITTKTKSTIFWLRQYSVWNTISYWLLYKWQWCLPAEAEVSLTTAGP